VVEHLADRLTNQMQRAATARAGLALNVKPDIPARQMRRQARPFRCWSGGLGFDERKCGLGRGAGPELVSLLDRLGAVYLDTGESRGLVPDSHPSVVGAMRGAVMGDADVVLTIGRRLDFQLAYGSPAVFQSAKFVRTSDCPLRCGTIGAAPWRSWRPPQRRSVLANNGAWQIEVHGQTVTYGKVVGHHFKPPPS
jgi:thiamine pyrophosphate-dependent enzyme